MKTLLMALVVVGLLAGPALADQCDLLLKQIKDDTAFRFDEKSSRADSLANAAHFLALEGLALHEARNHAGAMVKMKDAAKLIGLALRMK